MGKRGKKKKAIWLGQIFGKRRKKNYSKAYSTATEQASLD